ncbi:hypothetical protein OGATHE_001633 [Ogataea polymorpha]|uniref:Uncharacterized protein n=1 Tax=Ogataea polymorpha TaxID=460523 RepID=A0A9P8PNB9_9ASCO|nr:hypothetical protein OGATHE_001633 [Ogataea polymorpha]
MTGTSFSGTSALESFGEGFGEASGEAGSGLTVIVCTGVGSATSPGSCGSFASSACSACSSSGSCSCSSMSDPLGEMSASVPEAKSASSPRKPRVGGKESEPKFATCESGARLESSSVGDVLTSVWAAGCSCLLSRASGASSEIAPGMSLKTSSQASISSCSVPSDSASVCTGFSSSSICAAKLSLGSSSDSAAGT